jgi:hypothetical protein
MPKAAWALIAGCLMIVLGVEVGARVAIDRSSKIQRRVVSEYARARAIGTDRVAAAGGAGNVLVLGNSLLDEGVLFDRLQQGLTPWDARRFVVENTYFYDWYYGLKRLYREGAKPDVVVLMLTVGQWMPATSRGAYSAQYLFSTEDLPHIIHDLSLQPTQASDLFFANISKFWGVRAELRNVVLGHLMPDVGVLMSAIQPVNHKPLENVEASRIIEPRITRLKDLTDEHGTELILLVPPVLNPDDGAPGLMEAARRAGVRSLLPVASGTYNAGFYRDGFHLNHAGAVLFTDRLIGPLKQELTSATSTRTVDAAASE